MVEFISSVFLCRYVGSPMYTLQTKLIKIRHLLLDWCVCNRRSWGINWRDLSSILVSAANSITPGPAASLFITTKDECVARTHATFLYWRQRSKVKWDSLGDCHSKLLFASVQACRRRNNISNLQNISGEWITSPPALRTLISDFYSDLYEVHKPVSEPLVYDWEQLQLPLCLRIIRTS